MSFGFGVGDFLAVGTLAWKIYRSVKGMKDEFLELSHEVLAVHTLIKELEDEADDPKSLLNRRGASRRSELMNLIENLESALRELDEIVRKRQGLARRERRIWNQLRLASEDLGSIRSKLTFHMNAINTFIASLSQGALARMEPVLMEILTEIRQGRRPPSVVSIDEPGNVSGWRELELELAEDGISESDVAKHKAAIKVFLLSRLRDSSTTDSMSLDEVASVVESSTDQALLIERLSGSIPPSEAPSRAPTNLHLETVSLSTISTFQSFQTAPGEPMDDWSTETPVVRVSFAPSHRIPEQIGNPDIDGIDNRLGLLTYGEPSERSIYRYRHSVDATPLGTTTSEAPGTGKPAHMVLVIDPIHSSASKLFHAYLRSLAKGNHLVGEEIDTIRSTGWRMHESGGIDILQLDTLIKELLTSKKVEVPKPEAYDIKEFKFPDLLQFDHIIYIDSPTFRQFLEDNIQKIAKLKAGDEYADRDFARLTPFQLPSAIHLPESMLSGGTFMPDMYRNRQRLALEEIFRVIQRFVLDFLLREYGLKKTRQGFEKILSHRRPSKASSLTLDRKSSPALSD